MLASNDKDLFSKDGDIDYLLKSELLEPFPFQLGGQSLKDPFSKTVDSKDSIFDKRDAKKPVKRRTWKKPKGKPKRPLSAYNLFFQHEREKLVNSGSNDDGGEGNAPTEEKNSNAEDSTKSAKRRHRKTHGKIGFAQLARDISQKWKTLDAETLKGFEEKASAEKERYKKELEEWKKKTNSGKDTNKKASKKASISSVGQTSDILGLLEESSASFRTGSKKGFFASLAEKSMAEPGSMSAIPDTQSSGPSTVIDQTDLLARISKLNERRFATRQEHKRMLDATFALCRPNSPPAVQEPAPSSDFGFVQDESPDQLEMFSDTFFDDLDTEMMSL